MSTDTATGPERESASLNFKPCFMPGTLQHNTSLVVLSSLYLLRENRQFNLASPAFAVRYPLAIFLWFLAQNALW